MRDVERFEQAVFGLNKTAALVQALVDAGIQPWRRDFLAGRH